MQFGILLFGGACVQHAAILSLPSRAFAMEVRDGCNDVNVVVLLWSSILADAMVVCVLETTVGSVVTHRTML